MASDRTACEVTNPVSSRVCRYGTRGCEVAGHQRDTRVKFEGDKVYVLREGAYYTFSSGCWERLLTDPLGTTSEVGDPEVQKLLSDTLEREIRHIRHEASQAKKAIRDQQESLREAIAEVYGPPSSNNPDRL